MKPEDFEDFTPLACT